MTPREYIDEIVRPNLTDLAADQASVRLAMNAVHAVDALAARIYVAAGGRAATGVKDDTDFREALAKVDTSGNFRLLRDLAKALKHVVLTRGKPPVVGSASQVTASDGPFSAAGFEATSFAIGGVVTVTTDAGEVRPIEQTAAAALAFLEEEMARRGL